MTDRNLRIAIAGCGNISGPYAETLKAHRHIELLGAYDLIRARAEALTAKYGGEAYGSLDALLADPRVDLVVNLTIHHAHPDVITQCLNAGKHVYSEKPLALTYAAANSLVELAKARGLRLACAPITYMGEAQQTAWKAIREGKLGTVRAIYAEVNHGRIETWHPNPEPFYDVGPLFDVAVYPLTILTTIFGSARRVTGFGTVLYPDRHTLEGRPFTVRTPDFSVAAIEFTAGPVVRLTTNFYVGKHGKQPEGIEFHGDSGSLWLSSWADFSAPVELAQYEGKYEALPLVRPGYQGVEWCRAVVEMGEAIAAGRPQRATGAQAAHVVEIVSAIHESLAAGHPVAVRSTFTPPAPMAWAA